MGEPWAQPPCTGRGVDVWGVTRARSGKINRVELTGPGAGGIAPGWERRPPGLPALPALLCLQICALLFASLYILCHFIITHFKKHTDFAAVHDDEDAAVNRIALGLCTFTLAVALGAVLLLPFSIISNEVLLSFPHNYYIQWLNGSLIHGLWNLIFLFSNLSLVFLMPFAYFFTESEGFAGSKKGIMARVYETSVVLLLLTLLVLGMVWVASAIVSNDAASRQSLYDLWEFYLPYLYSCISLFGVLLLLLCTPFGLSTMFTVTGKLLVKPRPGLSPAQHWEHWFAVPHGGRLRGVTPCPSTSGPPSISCPGVGAPAPLLPSHVPPRPAELRHRASPWQRNLGYPLAMLGLLALTGISVLIVCFHVLELLLDDAAMPRGIQVPGEGGGQTGATLGTPFPSLGGVRSAAPPDKRSFPPPQIIGNCVSLLVLSSALPVFSRTLGITRFDLLGDFGRFNWLGNFYIVFLYNMGFAGLTTLCLVKRVSWAVQAELIRAFGEGTRGHGDRCCPPPRSPMCPPPTQALTLFLSPGLHKLPLPVTRSRPLGTPC
uniref:Limb development membrane protein 1 like n=1 Tax=Otus sunia TaxID=257818 RepID=A0A8C8B096_9STRI